MSKVDSKASVSEEVQIDLETGAPKPVFQFTDEDEGVIKTYPLDSLNISARASIMQIQVLEERLMKLQVETEDFQAALAHRRSTLRQRLPSDDNAEIKPLEKRH